MIFAYSLRQLASADAAVTLSTGPAGGRDDFAFLKRRLAHLLCSLNLPSEHKVHRWASERMAVMTSIDIKFIHLLINKLELALRGEHK
jgi:hypothetical protein